MKTGIASVKLALAGFIIPYMFVYNQKLMLENVGFIDGIQVIITSCVGVTLIAAAVEGYLYGKMHIVLRILSFGSALLLIDSGTVTDLMGVAGLIVIIIIQKFFVSKKNNIKGSLAS